MCSPVKNRHPQGGLSNNMFSKDEDRCSIPVQVHVNGTAVCKSKNGSTTTDFDELRVIDIGGIPHLGIVSHGEYCGGGAVSLLEHDIKVEDKRLMGTPLTLATRQSKFSIKISRRSGAVGIGDYDVIMLEVVKGRGDNSEEIAQEEANCGTMFEHIKYLPRGNNDELMRVLRACKTHESYEKQRKTVVSSAKRKKSRSSRTRGMMGNTLDKVRPSINNPRRSKAESFYGLTSARKSDRSRCKSLSKVTQHRYFRPRGFGATGTPRSNLMVNLANSGERAESSDFKELHLNKIKYKNVKKSVMSSTPKRSADLLSWRKDVTKPPDRLFSSLDYPNQLPLELTQSSDSFNGFSNLGNTCYMGSVLRGLANANNFSAILRSKIISEKLARKSSSIAHAFIDLLNMDAMTGRKTSLNPRPLKNLLGKKYRQFAGSAQQDAHEFLRHLLEEIQDELLMLTKRLVTFQSKIRSTLICPQCGDKRDKSEEFEDLSLDLPKKKSQTAISKLLWDYFHPSKLEYVCEKCNHNIVEKTPLIARLPNTLILHFKRFSHTSNVFNLSSYSKRCDPIKIPEILDLSEFVTEDVLKPSSKPEDNLISVPRKRDVKINVESHSSAWRNIPSSVGEDKSKALDSCSANLPRSTPLSDLSQNQQPERGNPTIPPNKISPSALAATPEVGRSVSEVAPASFPTGIKDTNSKWYKQREAEEKKFKDDMRLALQASLRDSSEKKHLLQSDSICESQPMEVPFLVSPIRAPGEASLTQQEEQTTSNWIQVHSRVEEADKTFINPSRSPSLSSSNKVVLGSEGSYGIQKTPKHGQTGVTTKESLSRGTAKKMLFGKRARELDGSEVKSKRFKSDPKTSSTGHIKTENGNDNPGGGCSKEQAAPIGGQAALDLALKLSKLEAIKMNKEEDDNLQKAIRLSMLEAGITTERTPEKKSKQPNGATLRKEQYLPKEHEEHKEDVSMPPSAQKKRKEGRSDCRYKLQAVIHHHGTGAGRGHYTTDVLRTQQGGGCEWEHHDDAYVSKTRLKNVIGEKSQRTAYIVFFSYFSDINPELAPS